MSCDGYGTDAVIYLKVKVQTIKYLMNCLITKNTKILQRLSDEANELLPIFNKTSSRFYNKSTVSAGDWSNQVKPKKKKEPIVI